MKKILQLGAVIFCMLVSQSVYSQYAEMQEPVVSGSSDYAANSQDGCPCDQPTGDCWCMYCRWEPCYYTTRRCVEEQIPCTKKCCRYVPKYYEVQRCRYVPEYYTETCCNYCCEYYDVPDCKCCKKWVCDQHCKYVPKYYWKHVCQPQQCCAPQCETNQCCE